MISLFYSWQSDLPNSTNRGFLESVLKESIEEVATDMEFTKAERGETIELDMDTKGIPGSPPIAEVIFNKISNCAVFVPDLSFVRATKDGQDCRFFSNSNVLIEYGYALSAVGYLRIVPIMNTAYGEVSMKSLPFNMRHFRHPIEYWLAEDATKEEKDKVKQKLIKEVSVAILEVLKQGTKPAPASHEPRPSTTDPSTFLQEGETLPLLSSYSGCSGDINLQIPKNQHMYLRIMPTNTTAPLSSRKRAYDLLLKSNVEHFGYKYHNSRYRGRNEYGAFAVDHEGSNICGLTQLFLNNELWGIDCHWLDKEKCMKHAAVGFLPSSLIEEAFTPMLAAYLSCYRDSLELKPPIKLMAGMTGVKGYQLAASQQDMLSNDGLGGHVVSENIEFECTIKDLDAEPTSILRPFFERVWEECGHTRPDREKL